MCSILSVVGGRHSHSSSNETSNQASISSDQRTDQGERKRRGVAMTAVANLRNGLSPRAGTGTRHSGRPDVVRPIRRPARRVVQSDGRRPARLVAAPHLVEAQQCEPRPVFRSVGWLVLIGALAFAVVLGIGWMLTSGPATGAAPMRTVLVQVHQGETLWGVAQRMAPSAQPVTEVAAIRQLNGLDMDSVLYPGELLKVPSDLSAVDAAKAGAVQR